MTTPDGGEGMSLDPSGRKRRKHARAVRAVIGVPLYNAVERGYFRDALDSLLAQAYPCVAFVFVDDCSTDGTSDVVAAIAAHDVWVYLSRYALRLLSARMKQPLESKKTQRARRQKKLQRGYGPA